MQLHAGPAQRYTLEGIAGSVSCVGLVAPFPRSNGQPPFLLEFAGMNVLAGVGVLTTPYALMEAGWVSLVLLFGLALICLYTGVMLRWCLDSKPGLATYPDIGQAAFGDMGRLVISVSSSVMILRCRHLSSSLREIRLYVKGCRLELEFFSAHK